MFPCVLLSLHRKPKNHHNRHNFWSTFTMLSGGTPTASNTSHSSNYEFRMTWTMLIREHLPQHKRKNSLNHNLDYLKYYFMFNRSWYSEVAVRIITVHLLGGWGMCTGTLTKLKIKIYRKWQFFMRLPPKDNSRLTLDPSLQWISGVCPDVSIKTSQNMLSFIEGKLSEERN